MSNTVRPDITRSFDTWEAVDFFWMIQGQAHVKAHLLQAAQSYRQRIEKFWRNAVSNFQQLRILREHVGEEFVEGKIPDPDIVAIARMLNEKVGDHRTLTVQSEQMKDQMHAKMKESLKELFPANILEAIPSHYYEILFDDIGRAS